MFRKVFKLLTSKFLLVCLILLAEIALAPTIIILLALRYPNLSGIYTVVITAINLVLTLYIIHSEMNAEYKIAWIVPILLLPPFSACAAEKCRAAD